MMKLKDLNPDLFHAFDNPLLQIIGSWAGERSPTSASSQGNGPIGKRIDKQPVIRIRPTSGELVGPGTAVRIGLFRRWVLS
jgi:hypothetical protein